MSLGETDMQSLSDAQDRAHLPFTVTCNANATPHWRSSVHSRAESAAEGESPGVGASAADTASGGAAPGLVYSQTSGTSLERAIRVDREANRLKRLQRSVLTSARLHVQQRPRWRVAMITLTYRPDVDWEPGQVSALVRHLRQWLKRKGIAMRFVWVQEFTKKGRPHYHMLVWLPLGITPPKPDKQGWWPCGMTKCEWARNAIGYIAKYASKGDSLALPAKGARMHGGGGLTDEALLEQRWWKLPTWLRSDVEPSDRVRRAAPRSGGGFVSPGTGEVYRSPWIVFFKGGQVYIQRRVVQ